jgi:thiamine biosynthesis lipoprotein
MSAMKALGINSGMVNAGGDLITWGKNKEGKDWSIGIADPNAKDQMFAWLSLRDMALVTSGDYEKYFIYRNERYGHILDPRTGYPSKGIKSVSILCQDVELADALATAVYVMGELKGMALIDQLNGIEGLIITEDDQVLQSKNLVLQYYSIQD